MRQQGGGHIVNISSLGGVLGTPFSGLLLCFAIQYLSNEFHVVFEGRAMPSVSEIARRAGVSKSTVSLVLNNRAHVSEVMRRRVLQVRDELLHEFSSSSRSPGQAISALLIHPATLRSSQVFRELLQGVQTGPDECGGRLTLAVH